MDCTKDDLLHLFGCCAADPHNRCRADPDISRAHMRWSAYAYHQANHCGANRAMLHASGTEGSLLISVDCIALDSGTLWRIREGLAALPNCAAANVYATHTHAGADTLGLWGPVGVNGKNDAYMEALIQVAIDAAHEAAADPQPGTMRCGWPGRRACSGIHGSPSSGWKSCSSCG